MKCNRQTVDDALMDHFGAIVMVARLSRASKVVLIGDVNNLHDINREILFDMRYCRPYLTTNIIHELFCTYRSPMDVVYAMCEVYISMYSSNPTIHSFRMNRFTGATIPKF